MKYLVCTMLSLSACGQKITCDDQTVLAELDQSNIKLDTIVTVSRDEQTGNLTCKVKMDAMFFDEMFYTVMKTTSGEIVVEKTATGGISGVPSPTGM